MIERVRDTHVIGLRADARKLARIYSYNNCKNNYETTNARSCDRYFIRGGTKIRGEIISFEETLSHHRAEECTGPFNAAVISRNVANWHELVAGTEITPRAGTPTPRMSNSRQRRGVKYSGQQRERRRSWRTSSRSICRRALRVDK